MQPGLRGARGKALWAGLRAGPFSVSPEELHCSYSLCTGDPGEAGGQRGMCAPLSAGRALGQDCALGETLVGLGEAGRGCIARTPYRCTSVLLVLIFLEKNLLGVHCSYSFFVHRGPRGGRGRGACAPLSVQGGPWVKTAL